MKKRFTEEQIISILKQQEAGMAVKDLIRQHNITEQTFYRRKSKYASMEVKEAQRLKQLEDKIEVLTACCRPYIGQPSA